MILMDAHQVAEILHCSYDNVLDLARTGELPGAKIGVSWMFSDEGVHQYFREESERQTEERRAKAGIKVASKKALDDTRGPVQPIMFPVQPLPKQQRRTSNLPKFVGQV